MELKDKLKAIKQSFRLEMNGPVSQSMRAKGVDYKINWGIPLVSLNEQAKEYGKDYDLAIALFKENIRECKILATLIMPAERMDAELADVWLEQTETQEIAELLAMNLFQYVDYASVLAFECIASDKILYQICGYSLLSRLFGKGMKPNERGINEFLDQAATALVCDNMGVKHAAMNAVMNFMELDSEYELIARKALHNVIDF